MHYSSTTTSTAPPSLTASPAQERSRLSPLITNTQQLFHSNSNPGFPAGIHQQLQGQPNAGDREVPPSALGMIFNVDPSTPASATTRPSLLQQGQFSPSPLSADSSRPSKAGDSAAEVSVAPPLPSPLKQPTETILAPELPSNVNIVIPPFQSLDPAAAHDIIAPPLVPAPLTGSSSHPGSAMTSPMAEDGTAAAQIAAAASAAAANVASISSPLLPGSTPPLPNAPNTLPAAAPIAALHPGLATDPEAQASVAAATVDLGAGPDGVPTLLTWKADQEFVPSGAKMVPGAKGKGKSKPGEEGQQEEEEAGMMPQTPEKVFVTGTFAKGWNAKIELRRKEYVHALKIRMQLLI